MYLPFRVLEELMPAVLGILFSHISTSARHWRPVNSPVLTREREPKVIPIEMTNSITIIGISAATPDWAQ